MRFSLFGVAVASAFAMTSAASCSHPAVPDATHNPQADKTSEIVPASHAATVGTVVNVHLDGDARSADVNDRLHFCVFENGRNDLIYVGTNYGMWSGGEFDLYVKGKKAFTGAVPHLVFGGVIIQMGDVMNAQPESNFSSEVYVGRVSGVFEL